MPSSAKMAKSMKNKETPSAMSEESSTFFEFEMSGHLKTFVVDAKKSISFSSTLFQHHSFLICRSATIAETETTKRLANYFNDQSLCSFSGRRLVTAVAQRMLLSGDATEESLAVQFLWIYETMYEQLVASFPHIYRSPNAHTQKEVQMGCDKALDMIILATTDTPDERSRAKIPSVATEESLLMNRRRNQKVRPLLAYQINVLE
jgi:hypothetical protein